MEAKQYSMQHEVGAQSEPFDKSRAMHTQYVGLTNVYYIQNNRDIHKVTLNPFTLKPLFQSQTLLSTKWKKLIEFGYMKYAENTSTH